MEQFDKGELKRYARHLILPEVGIEGQEKLKKASVLIIGVGGLGSPLALYLAASGIGTLGLVDFDEVDESNLQRQVLYSTADVGLAKVEVARQKIKAINPYVNVKVFNQALDRGNAKDLFARFDIVVDGTDNFPTRYLVNEVCMELGKPNVYASIHGFEGQLTTFIKGQCPCYSCLFPQPPVEETVSSCAEAGVLGVLPGIMGTLQANEVIKLILGQGTLMTGRLLLFNALELDFQEVQLKQNEHCPVCSQQVKEEKSIDFEGLCHNGGSQKPSVPEIDKEALMQLLERESKPYLIDVRPATMRTEGMIIGTRNILIEELNEQLSEVLKDREIVVYCQMGVMSQQAVMLMQQNGFSKVRSLKDGFRAFAMKGKQFITAL
ncbi:MAG: HesA/MoeB/ThiF family protein [Carboxylicivirga sp.]|jgi:adenylyltransferase/sulfurtransferase|nr:HesA/MoeB/ThiF family protein [Carboxylicivirga sp.]